jgi:hypothetical protein
VIRLLSRNASPMVQCRGSRREGNDRDGQDILNRRREERGTGIRREGTMVRASGVIHRWLAPGVALLMAVGLVLGAVGQTEADETAGWEALGPEGLPIDRLYTPTSGALFARALQGLFRSDDGGLTWRTVPRPADTNVVTVSPMDHQRLYAAGKGGVYSSEDGGESWQRVSEQGAQWMLLEVSPADAATLYGVALLSPPAENGANLWHEFRVSHDGGATWETVRTQRERMVPGTHPCGYTVKQLQPHSVSTVRVLTIEGCTGRGMDPLAGMSPDEGRTVTLFPDLKPESWAANAAAGGGGANPDRWYVSLFKPGIPYNRIRHSRVMRTDDGVTWITVYEDHGGSPDRNTAKPVDFVSELAYNPQRPDDVYAVVVHYEPDPRPFYEHTYAGFTVRMSRDGGSTWTDLGAPDGPSVSGLAVGVDGRYLFAATSKGVYRIALPQ